MSCRPRGQATDCLAHAVLTGAKAWVFLCRSPNRAKCAAQKHTQACTHTRAHTHTRTHACVCTHIHTHTHTRTHTHARAHTHTHARTHTHTHYTHTLDASTCLSVCLSVCRSVCQSVNLSGYLYVFISRTTVLSHQPHGVCIACSGRSTATTQAVNGLGCACCYRPFTWKVNKLLSSRNGCLL